MVRKRPPVQFWLWAKDINYHMNPCNDKQLTPYNTLYLQNKILDTEIIYLKETESTIDIMSQKDHKCLVLTEMQHRGRGQKDRRWDCFPGRQILMSFGQFKWSQDINQHSLSLYSALLLTLKNYNEACRFKAPNDFYVREKKVCGILLERRNKKNYIHLGLNVIPVSNTIYGSLLTAQSVVKAHYREDILVNLIEAIEGAM